MLLSAFSRNVTFNIVKDVLPRIPEHRKEVGMHVLLAQRSLFHIHLLLCDENLLESSHQRNSSMYILSSPCDARVSSYLHIGTSSIRTSWTNVTPIVHSPSYTSDLWTQGILHKLCIKYVLPVVTQVTVLMSVMWVASVM